MDILIGTILIGIVVVSVTYALQKVKCTEAEPTIWYCEDGEVCIKGLEVCSDVLNQPKAEQVCRDFGPDWEISRGKGYRDGAITCERNGITCRNNCNSCDDSRLIVWKNGIDSSGNTDANTKAGFIYGGPRGNLSVCGNWMGDFGSEDGTYCSNNQEDNISTLYEVSRKCVGDINCKGFYDDCGKGFRLCNGTLTKSRSRCGAILYVKRDYDVRNNGEGCGIFSVPEDECKHAAGMVGYASSMGYATGNWAHLPNGCFVGHSHTNWQYTYFNHHHGKTNNHFISICKTTYTA